MNEMKIDGEEFEAMSFALTRMKREIRKSLLFPLGVALLLATSAMVVGWRLTH